MQSDRRKSEVPVTFLAREREYLTTLRTLLDRKLTDAGLSSAQQTRPAFVFFCPNRKKVASGDLRGWEVHLQAWLTGRPKPVEISIACHLDQAHHLARRRKAPPTRGVRPVLQRAGR
jgi:hypothetical protein